MSKTVNWTGALVMMLGGAVAGWTTGPVLADGDCVVTYTQTDSPAETEVVGSGTFHYESANASLKASAAVGTLDEEFQEHFGDAQSFATATRMRTNVVTVTGCVRQVVGTYAWSAWGSASAYADDGHAEASAYVMGTDDASHSDGVEAEASVTSTGGMESDGPRGVFELFPQQCSVTAMTPCAQGQSLFSLTGVVTGAALKERSFSATGEGQLIWSTLAFTITVYTC